MPQFFLNKRLIVLLVSIILLVALIGISLKERNSLTWPEQFVKDTVGVVERVFQKPAKYVAGFFENVEDVKRTYEENKELKAKLDNYAGLSGKVKQLEDDLFELYKDPNLDIKPPQLEKRGGAYYSDAACSLITSIYNNKGDIQPVNTRNNGTIASLPHDSAVEVNCIITKEGPKPIAVGDLPVPVRGLVQQIKSFERTTIEAAVTGDYHKALLAMTINPLVPSDKVAKQILDEMLEAHKEHLPQFFKKVEK